MRSQAVSGVAWRRRLEEVLSKKTSAREVDDGIEVEVEGMRIVYWFLSQAQAPWSSVIVLRKSVIGGVFRLFEVLWWKSSDLMYRGEICGVSGTGFKCIRLHSVLALRHRVDCYTLAIVMGRVFRCESLFERIWAHCSHRALSIRVVAIHNH